MRAYAKESSRSKDKARRRAIGNNRRPKRLRDREKRRRARARERAEAYGVFLYEQRLYGPARFGTKARKTRRAKKLAAVREAAREPFWKRLVGAFRRKDDTRNINPHR